ncbi:MAG: response regulator [Proteobacteria bacterium]|nr:response regulator [Pseudomonadota bacterium]
MAKSPKILIVDDEERLRDSMKKMLEMDCFSVSTAENGHDALEQLVTKPFDLAIVDLIMPGTDGMWLIDKVNQRQLDVGIIVATGHGSLETAVKTMKMGVWEFIQKPVDYEMIKIVIKRSLDRIYTLREKKALDKKMVLQNEELRTANEKLLELDQLKNNFLSKAAHELRSPLTVLTCSMEIMKEDLMSNELENLEAYLDNALTFTKNMSNMISNMLDINLIVSGNIKVQVNSTDIGEVIRETAAGTKALLEKKEIALALKIPENLGEPSFSKERISQVLVNLIVNASKFTDKGGQIEIAVKDNDSDITVTVKDTGCGIPPEDIDFIFEEFFQAGNGEKQGVGLGLAICRKIMEAHNGKIWAESTLGSGSTFHFSLPKRSES